MQVILKRLPDLVYQPWVALPNKKTDDFSQRAPFRTLLAMEMRGQHDYVHEDGEVYLIQDILKIISIEKQAEEKQVIHVHDGGIYVGNNLHNRGDFVLGNKNQYFAEIQSFDKDLSRIVDDIDIEAGTEKLGQQALRELAILREALAQMQQGDVAQQKTAKEKISNFVDRFVEGSGKTITVLKTMKDGGKAIEWLNETMPSIVAVVAKLF